MKEELDEQEEDVLRRIVLGEAARDAEGVRERIAASPALARAVAEWERLQEQLERVRREDEELVAAARERATGPDRELVGALLDRRPEPNVRSRGIPWVPVAAALVAAATLLFLLPRGDGDAPTTLLGSRGCERPRGVVERYSPFVVDHDLEPMWTIEIVVSDIGGTELLRSGRLESTSWELTREQAALLEGVSSIRWRYDILDPRGDPREFGACDASRSR